MAIDAYSLCPGGTGKKIKFCCNDFLPELQKIDRMIEGEQYLACLKHVDQLWNRSRGEIGRACWRQSASCCGRPISRGGAKAPAAFMAKFPNNQIALSEAAIAGGRERRPRGARARATGAARRPRAPRLALMRRWGWWPGRCCRLVSRCPPGRCGSCRRRSWKRMIGP